MALLINKDVFTAVPTLRCGVVVLSDINNAVDISAFFDAEYAKTEREITEKFAGSELCEYPLIKKWREIYRNFGEKKARSSIEALIRRVSGGKGLYRINPLVDLYNLASLKFEFPFGGEDRDTMTAPLELAIATGTEEFVSLGTTEIEYPNAGEIIYHSGKMVVCRNFNYRESDITKLTEKTTSAIIVIEDVLGSDQLDAAMDWIGERAETLLGAKIISREIIKKGA
ncbi:MAG: phenylalanine--tRNA ligase beta subunit-related protein [Firmicutes bacterium]|nr:phenylalanine--tRNA ligase beta subunit-related protein [Bacillota bacterium]